MPPKWAQNGLISPVGAPQMVSDEVWKNVFLTHFWSQNSPFSRHFGIFGGPKWATTSSKRSKNTCFSVAHGLGSFLRKFILCPYWTLLTHLGTHLFGLELAACRSLVGLGIGV